MISSKICKDATEFIGNTPMVYLNKVTEGLHAKIACKVEYLGPSCSVKDRVGFQMIDDAEKAGKIKPGVTVLIEPTSGNTGIALAAICTVKGYNLILVMPASTNVERRTLLRAYGAVVILTDPSRAVLGAMERAQEIHQQIPNSFILNQFANPANPQNHFDTTAVEIWQQTQGKVDICCFGVGSGGTVTGVGRWFKQKHPNVKMYAVEPYESSVINGFTHGSHKIPGIGAGFVPINLDRSVYEECLRVVSDDAIQMAKRLAREEGLLVSISAGANVCAALQLAKRPENAGKLIVTLLGSFGERDLSTALYIDIRRECELMGTTTLQEDMALLKEKHHFI